MKSVRVLLLTPTCEKVKVYHNANLILSTTSTQVHIPERQAQPRRVYRMGWIRESWDGGEWVGG
jgi:hypothetical protein